jgi:hypothetical protein
MHQFRRHLYEMFVLPFFSAVWFVGSVTHTLRSSLYIVHIKVYKYRTTGVIIFSRKSRQMKITQFAVAPGKSGTEKLYVTVGAHLI